MQRIVTLVRRHGGVCRSAVLRAAGTSKWHLRAAVECGMLVRPARGWVALADADPELVFAARHGVILTCVTQAKRIGLWAVEAGDLHLALPNRGSQIRWRGAGTRHWEKPLILRRPGLLEDPVENVLQIAANCLPREHALTLLESALNKKLVTMAALGQLPLSARLRALVDGATPFSDSGLETLFRDRLGWLRIPIRIQAHVVGQRVDLLIGRRLIAQIDGSSHTGHQRDRDTRHDAQSAMEGYHVLRFGYRQVMDRWEEVEAAVLGAIARGLHLVPTR